jgi:hypothetical protein
MMPTELLKIKDKRGTPTRSKRRSTSHVAHVSVPLKGLSRLAQLNEADPLLASILTNFIVVQDRISVRPGYRKEGVTLPGTPPPAVSTLIPFYGVGQTFIVAAGNALYNTNGTKIGTTDRVDDKWQWTSFANLNQDKYTVMVNGHTVPIVWNGTNGTIPSTRGGVIDLPTVDPQRHFREVELIKPRAAPPTFNETKMDKIVSHMNRLWLADSHDLIVYYWPLQTAGGALGMLPLNAYFRRGGVIKSLQTWTYSGGAGMDSLLVIFSSNGEAAIFSGVDPAVDFKLVGVFRFDTPMAPGATVNYGGELYVLISSGLVPMSTLLKAEEDNLGTSDQNIMQEFIDVSKTSRDDFGWSVIVNSQTNHAICNMPLGNKKYQQLVRFMPNAVWSKWTDVPARCWAWLGNHAYFGTDDGQVFMTGPEYLDDVGKPIDVDVRFAWSSFKSVNKKQFKMMRLYTISDHIPQPYVDVEVDYAATPPTNLPDVSVVGVAADWGVPAGAVDDPTVGSVYWDAANWVADAAPRQIWQGVTGLGRVGAPRIRASLQGTTFSLTGADVIYEEGGLM